ncbi:PREDICTED: triggering receptor expressed on myeloid cells 2-like [Gavialis gangeticus]|uniref:triggering receptor expressed on myeloid cells 2-like n=1 Tax=Gavialis gangeticus TaxID=94835 RepID=UPI00092EA288|nr:PREDICTED: triggering receptor expressed on myeloid cells 2-like [Gavialis gangeticus]
MDMETLVHLIFLVSLAELYAAENTTVVYGMEGETISINCTYGPKEHKWKEKSWCKQVDETQCQRVVSARRFWLPFLKNRNGTTSISDNIHKGVLMVTIKRLQKQDAGLYQCKTDFLGTTRTLQKVKVEVLEGQTETQVLEDPRAVHSISSSLPAPDFSLFYIIAAFLTAKFLAAILIFIVATSKRSKGTEEDSHSQNEHPLLLLRRDLHEGTHR